MVLLGNSILPRLSLTMQKKQRQIRCFFGDKRLLSQTLFFV
ncbi:hypothetical protein PCS81218_00100 [Streptococcus pneumoniae PCS81218]|nr:hypothetical protein PCS81218_00100 [Streptococcus pneumoniae PCS81218]